MMKKFGCVVMIRKADSELIFACVLRRCKAPAIAELTMASRQAAGYDVATMQVTPLAVPWVVIGDSHRSRR